MVKSAKAALEEVDVICFMVEVTGWRKADEEIIAELGKIDTPVFLVINKVDLVSDEEQANFLRMVENKYDFAEIFVLSALERTGLNQFVETLVSYLPEGPKYYPDDWVTDHPERFVMAEFIREQILHNTEEEIPHSVAVDIDEVKADPEKILC